jgi:4-coumarate--CoA ligase
MPIERFLTPSAKVDQMPHNSPFQIDIPRSNILSFLFPPSALLSDRPLWIDADDTAKSLSSRTAVQWIKRLAMGLERKGLQRGRVCLVFSTSHIFMPVAYLAIAGMGSVFSGCNPVYGVEEVAFQIKDTGAEFILVDPTLLDTLEKATQKTGFSSEKIFLFSDRTLRETRGYKDWRSILASEKEARAWTWPELGPEMADSCTAVLNYSSG